MGKQLFNEKEFIILKGKKPRRRKGRDEKKKKKKKESTLIFLDLGSVRKGSILFERR
jgi:hypothetical protein